MSECGSLYRDEGAAKDKVWGFETSSAPKTIIMRYFGRSFRLRNEGFDDTASVCSTATLAHQPCILLSASLTLVGFFEHSTDNKSILINDYLSQEFNTRVMQHVQPTGLMKA